MASCELARRMESYIGASSESTTSVYVRPRSVSGNSTDLTPGVSVARSAKIDGSPLDSEQVVVDAVERRVHRLHASTEDRHRVVPSRSRLGPHAVATWGQPRRRRRTRRRCEGCHPRAACGPCRGGSPQCRRGLRRYPGRRFGLTGFFHGRRPTEVDRESTGTIQPGEFHLKVNRKLVFATFQLPDQQGYVLVVVLALLATPTLRPVTGRDRFRALFSSHQLEG